MAIKMPRDEKKITAYVTDRTGSYFSSQCHRILKGRVSGLRSAIDMQIRSNNPKARPSNSFLSKIYVPLVNESATMRGAMIASNFRNDPFFAIDPVGDTPYENAMSAQDTLNANMKRTRFRADCFRKIKNSVRKYGSSVVLSWPSAETEMVKRTQKTDMGYERMNTKVSKPRVFNRTVNILNYFQNENDPDSETSDYRGFIERMYLSKLIETIKTEKNGYIKKNVIDTVEKAKKGFLENNNYFSEGGRDWKMGYIDVVKWFGNLEIRGNEGDNTKYYLEMVDGKIIRFFEMDYDNGICPLTVLGLEKRDEYWWHNADCEKSVPFENFMNVFLSMTADNAMRAAERYIFFPRGQINTPDIANRHKNGGWIPMDIKGDQRLNNLIYPYQGQDISNNNANYVMRELKEARQRVNSRPDLQRTAQPGSMPNKTATAANMLNEQGDVVEMDLMEGFSWDLITMGKKTLRLIQQYYPDQFRIRPDAKQPGIVLEKEQILGDFEFTMQTNLMKNKISEGIRLQNVVTALLNWQGSGHPDLQPIKVIKAVKEWGRKVDLPGDVDDFIPEPQEQPQMQGPAQMQVPQLPPGMQQPPQPQQMVA